MKKYLIAALAASTMVANVSVHAGVQKHGIHQRQHHQVIRIHEGVKSGALTRHEAKKLIQEELRIQRMARKFRADGKLTLTERRRLRHSAYRLNHHIYHEMHDAQQRPHAENSEQNQ